MNRAVEESTWPKLPGVSPRILPSVPCSATTAPLMPKDSEVAQAHPVQADLTGAARFAPLPPKLHQWNSFRPDGLREGFGVRLTPRQPVRLSRAWCRETERWAASTLAQRCPCQALRCPTPKGSPAAPGQPTATLPPRPPPRGQRPAQHPSPAAALDGAAPGGAANLAAPLAPEHGPTLSTLSTTAQDPPAGPEG